MRSMTALTVGLTLGIASLASAAHAACPATAAVFLLDQSNTMNDAGMSGLPKRDIALTKMLNDYHALASGTPVGVYGFGNTPQYDPNYMHTYVAVDPVNPKKAVIDDVTITAAFTAAHDAIIPGTWWTPLAGAACDVIQFDLTNLTDASCLVGNPITTHYQLYLYSDGIENSTPGDEPGDPNPHACSGPPFCSTRRIPSPARRAASTATGDPSAVCSRRSPRTSKRSWVGCPLPRMARTSRPRCTTALRPSSRCRATPTLHPPAPASSRPT